MKKKQTGGQETTMSRKRKQAEEKWTEDDPFIISSYEN